jgi:hypothetical protein
LSIFRFQAYRPRKPTAVLQARVVSESNEIPVRYVTVTVIHDPTQNKYIYITNKDGYFYFFNLKPGGPYSITFSSVGYETLKKNDSFIHLSVNIFFLAILKSLISLYRKKL